MSRRFTTPAFSLDSPRAIVRISETYELAPDLSVSESHSLPTPMLLRDGTWILEVLVDDEGLATVTTFPQ